MLCTNNEKKTFMTKIFKSSTIIKNLYHPISCMDVRLLETTLSCCKTVESWEFKIYLCCAQNYTKATRVKQEKFCPNIKTAYS